MSHRRNRRAEQTCSSWKVRSAGHVRHSDPTRSQTHQRNAGREAKKEKTKSTGSRPSGVRFTQRRVSVLGLPRPPAAPEDEHLRQLLLGELAPRECLRKSAVVIVTTQRRRGGGESRRQTTLAASRSRRRSSGRQSRLLAQKGPRIWLNMQWNTCPQGSARRAFCRSVCTGGASVANKRSGRVRVREKSQACGGGAHHPFHPCKLHDERVDGLILPENLARRFRSRRQKGVVQPRPTAVGTSHKARRRPHESK